MTEGNHFGLPIVGSLVRWALGTNLRAIRVDDEGRLVVISAAGPSSQVQIFGVAGDGTTLNPFRQVDFRPQLAGGSKTAFGPASVAQGPLTVQKTYHLFCDQVCYVNKGGAGVVATVNSTALQAGPVYEYIPTAVGVDDHIGVIQDTVGGSLWISRVED